MSRRQKAGLGLALLLLGFLLLPVPRPTGPRSGVLLDSQGRLLGARVASDQQWRFGEGAVLPQKYIDAVVRFEDRRFYLHPGVDPLAIGRALWTNLRSGDVKRGGSTITMQVVRISRGNPARTYGEKLIEAALALRLEAAASKAELLALYAANAPFGGNTVGLEAASWRYFGRPPGDLSWAEAATLAVLPNAPSLIHPGKNREVLRGRRDALLRSLAEDGRLSASDLEVALAEPLLDAPRPLPQDAPHLLVAAGETRVQSTLDGDLQRRAVEVLARHHAGLVATGVNHAAAIIADLESGRVRAYVGNVVADDPEGDQVDVAQAARSTGSLLKPFLYAAMLEDGRLLPTQLVPDVPTRFGAFAPENFDRRYEGALPASLALARSRNVPAVWMLREYGVDRFSALLKRGGLSTLFRPAQDYGLSLIIGGAEGKLWELVGLYRDLALSVTHADGALPPALRWREDSPGPERPALWDAGAAWLTLQALYEVNRPGAELEWRSFGGSDVIAWKTGTSYGFRDGWAIGLTPTHVIGVWAGNASGEGKPHLTGFEAAAPMLFDLFDLVQTSGRFERPDGDLVTVQVCAHSGMLAGPDCSEKSNVLAPRAGQRGPSCSFCRLIQCDAGCAHRVHSDCSAVSDMHPTPWFTLPPAMEAYYSRRHADYRELPPWREDCASAIDQAPLTCLFPAGDAVVAVPRELNGQRGAVVFEASHRDPRARVYWHLDDAYLSTTTAPHQLSLSPPPGEHVLTLVDEDGYRVQRRFTVLDGQQGR